MDIVVGSMLLITGVLALIPAAASVATYRAALMGPRRYRSPEDQTRCAVMRSLYTLQIAVIVFACRLIAGGILVFTARDIAVIAQR